MNSKIKCLVVDDKADDYIIIKKNFGKLDPDIEIDHAVSAEQSLEKIKSNEYDILLVDYLLPGKNGLQLLEYLRNQGSDIPLIFLTNYGDEEVCSKAFRHGADDYFSKMTGLAHFPRLLNSIRNSIERRKKDGEILRANKRIQKDNLKLKKMMKLIRATQEQIIQSEKISAMGTIISGIAHELNNPLAVVAGYSELLGKSTIELPDKHKNKLAIIHQEASRACQIVNNLLTLVKKHPMEKSATDVNGAIRKVIELKKYQLGVRDIEIKTELRPLPSTMADPHQLLQMILNMINNAQEAVNTVTGIGKITIRTALEDENIIITIEDNGPGISDNHLKKVFDPFFTTKGKDKGTGLGLSICNEIIRNHKGHIGVKSESGQGTVFTITLPVIKPAEKPLEKEVKTAEKTISPKNVMVVDDEKSVRTLLTELLNMQGHSVHSCASAGGAIEELSKNEFDLIISDVIMPEVDGQQFYEKAVNIQPSMRKKFIFLTGDVLSDKPQALISSTGCACLKKPFSLMEFQKVIENFFYG